MRLYLNNISVSFGSTTILQNVSFEANTKDKIAIIGRNGAGKTTLLKVITGEQEIDLDDRSTINDKIQKSGKFNIGYLKQIAFDDDNETFENELLKSYQDILDLKKQIDELEVSMQLNCTTQDAIRYEKLLLNYQLLGGYTYLKEYNTAIKKFGFNDNDKTKKLSEFSGGQKTKIALLKLLLSKPDLLILDEPTNHLDITSIQWLENYLAEYSKAIIVVSHDRAFLDKFVNVVYEIERTKSTKYIGNYTQYIKTKTLNHEKNLKEYKAYTEEKNRLQTLADRFRYKATKAKMAQSKLKQIDRMEVIDKPDNFDTKVFSMNINPKTESGEDVIIAKDIEIGYNTVLSKLSFKVNKGDKIGVIGSNGIGKSTLLKSIVEKIPLLNGSLKFGTNVEIGYFDQQSATNSIENETVLENFLKCYPEEDTQNARNILGIFCFSQDDVFKNLRDLSGGERVRLELCKILKKQPNLLILDEPTNHMDILGRESLENMLQQYKGTIIFVSHDRYFVNKIANHLIVFEKNDTKVLRDTTYNEYVKSLQEKPTEIINTHQKDENLSKNKENKPNLYLLNKEKAKNNAKRKKLESKIELLENEINDIYQIIQSPEVCSDYTKILEYQSQIDQKNIELENLMNEWIQLSE